MVMNLCKKCQKEYSEEMRRRVRIRNKKQIWTPEMRKERGEWLAMRRKIAKENRSKIKVEAIKNMFES